MAGRYGSAAANDIVPNGGIWPIADLALPGSLVLASAAGIPVYGTAGTPSVLNIIASSTFQISTAATPTAGVNHAAEVELYIPLNGASVVFFSGSGTARLTMYTVKNNEG